jgi:hypothetical protein
MIRECWLRTKVLPILKPRKDPELSDSYRLISLLPCGRKLLEKMMCTRLFYWAKKYDVLSSSQYDFRKGRGTKDCLALLTTNVHTSFERKHQTVAEFIDISGLNDNVLIDIRCDILRKRGTTAGREIYVLFIMAEGIGFLC